MRLLKEPWPTKERDIASLYLIVSKYDAQFGGFKFVENYELHDGEDVTIFLPG